MRRSLRLGLALSIGCCLAGPVRSQPASRPAPTAFHFTVAGDPRSNVTGFAAVVQAIRTKVVDASVFHVSIGDNTPPSRIRAAIDEHLGASTIWFPGVGNHEARDKKMMAWLREEYDRGHDKRPALKAHTNQDGPTGCKETTYSWDPGI